ncbi:DEAD/DEAH box helicase [Pseudoduganella sp. GCM10020061]|uniref:DEAD/DEAH box helicase n=1 Tax=Pseudoduganella sp. GCM10020061 TaxID=3317345 RepID=UPI0036329A4B
MAEHHILALLTLAGEAMGRPRIREHLARAGLTAEDADIEAELEAMVASGAIREVAGRGWSASPDAGWDAVAHCTREGSLPRLGAAYLQLASLRSTWDGRLALRSYRQGIALLRIALLVHDDTEQVMATLAACLDCHEANYVHPFVEALGRPFRADVFARIHPQFHDLVLTSILDDALHTPAIVADVRSFAEHLIERGNAPAHLRLVMAEHMLLCGRLEDALALVADNGDAEAAAYRNAVTLLRGDDEAALAMFADHLKALRRETGKRKAIFPGLPGILYVMALLRTGRPEDAKAAGAYIDIAAGAKKTRDASSFEQLRYLHGVKAGTTSAEAFASSHWPSPLQPFFVRTLVQHWIGTPDLQAKRNEIGKMLALSQQAGFDLITAQLASVLGRLGDLDAERLAVALRQQHRFGDMATWIEREEAWQRQLNALMQLQAEPAPAAGRESRLVWLVRYDVNYGVALEAREQKRDAKGGWSRGREPSMARLLQGLDCMTAQDRAAASILSSSPYYDGFSAAAGRAMASLVGHPFVFWAGEQGTRVDVVAGAPEVMVRSSGNGVVITLSPPVSDKTGAVVVTRETPSRLRVVTIGDEHRRIGAIIGNGLEVPRHAEQQVLRAIGAISSIVTVQSDIGSSAQDIDTIEADPRMHVHLVPYQQGLRMQVLVRPLPGASYYAPGSGAEVVLADVSGVRTQARRDLNAEKENERQLVAACSALEAGEFDHGEWLLGQPLACLELVDQLQQLDPAKVVTAWPEGERFRVSRHASKSTARISVKRDKDWFAVEGEVEVDEGRVLDLRALLDAIRAGKGRFIQLGENEFAALSSELHRRLMELADFGQEHGKGVRIHPLAAFALDGLGDSASVRTDKHWKEHLARMRAVDQYVPEVPSTLQAELRDYQREGFEWLSRLAHWGVGACLADDMGLGKTVQALALILQRAPAGPTLVVAPTSVAMNWAAEAARFAPTLNVKLFGEGDRAAQLKDAQPFDLVIASYGLLQLEADKFAGRRWTTVVLDEAQAIKNSQTKRSQAVMALQADFRMVATGTPLENHLGELWNLFNFINPGLLGTADQFQMRFAGPIEKAQDKRAAAGARARLRRLVGPFILRRTKAQVLSELPARTEIVLPVELTQDEKALYESLRREALERIASVDAPDSQKSIQILAEMMRLRRACCNPELVAPGAGIPSSKLIVFARLLEELLENRHKVLVFSQFVDHLTLIRKHLDKMGIAYQYLDGSTPQQQRKGRVDAFQAGEGDVFLISLKAGGVGINLTAADYVVHMDPWWNPAVEDQASDRAHRMGQQRPVTIYRLVARGTIEEGIVDLHKHKRDLADSLLAGTDAAARMSPRDMLDMLQEGLGDRHPRP